MVGYTLDRLPFIPPHHPLINSIWPALFWTVGRSLSTHTAQWEHANSSQKSDGDALFSSALWCLYGTQEPMRSIWIDTKRLPTQDNLPVKCLLKATSWDKQSTWIPHPMSGKLPKQFLQQKASNEFIHIEHSYFFFVSMAITQIIRIFIFFPRKDCMWFPNV